MLTCIARPKKLDSESDDPSSRGAKSLTCQLKEMALKASGSYKQCGPCAPSQSRLSRGGESDSESSRRRWGKEMEARLKGISSGEGTPSSSGRRTVVVLEEEGEPKEWVAQVEPGVLITFVSLPRGGNHLKRIRFRYATLISLTLSLSLCVVLLIWMPFRVWTESEVFVIPATVHFPNHYRRHNNVN